MQASMAAFLNRRIRPSTQSEANAVASARQAEDGSSAPHQNKPPAEEPSQPQHQSQTEQQAAQQPSLEQQPTYAAQLSAAIAASLEGASLPTDPPPDPEAADKSPSTTGGRLPFRTDSRLDVQNNGQYRAWAALMSQAGQGRQAGGSGGASNQSAAATAWQVRS